MENRDLRTLVELGRALWTDPGLSDPAMIETLSVVSLVDLVPERALEKTSGALLERARAQGMAEQTRAWLRASSRHEPFFRLPAEQRFALCALHRARWSYARLARVMSLPVPEVEALAWKARVETAVARGAQAPVGGRAGASCPEYDASRPWTQRFLDEEIPQGADRVFLQNHMMACSSCFQAMSCCRDLYYAVERMVPALEGQDEAGEAIGVDTLVAALEAVCLRGRELRNVPALGKGTLLRSFRSFLRHRDIQLLLLAFAAALVWSCWRRH